MKILIITKSIKFITIISNFISINFNNISILIANSIQSAHNRINTYDIKFIIVDGDSFELNSYKNIANYFPLILINSQSYNYSINSNKNISCVSLDNLDYLKTIISDHICSFNTLNNTKIKILDELLKFGVNVKHNGTKYITDVILMLKFYNNNNNIKDIYSVLSYKYNTTDNNIKSNILKAIDYIYYETEYSNLKSYFSFFLW